MNFATVWLPNIVCLIVGLIVGYFISRHQAAEAAAEFERRSRAAALEAERQQIMLTTILVAAEKQGSVELARDEQGRITGGHNVTVELRGQAMSIKSNAPTANIESTLAGSSALATTGEVIPVLR